MIDFRDVLVPAAVCLGAGSLVMLVVAVLLQAASARATYYVDRKLGEARATRTVRLGLGAFVAAMIAAFLAAAETFWLGSAQDLSAASGYANFAVSTAAGRSAPTSSAPDPTLAAWTPSPPRQGVAEPPTRAPASPQAVGPRLTLRALASGVDAAGLPVNSGDEFERGARSIYVFYDFAGAADGRVQHAWFRDGRLVHTGSETLPPGAFGNARLVWRPSQMLEPGRYEVRVSLDDRPAFAANFTVR